jgi:hypothetical protein
MQENFSKLLTDLRIAVHHSLTCDNVLAAMAALEGAGHHVNVALDVTLDRQGNEECFDVAKGEEAIAGGKLELTRADTLFLHSLRIAA